ncbi:Vacuolar protein sorting-associated protein 8 [Exophiala xenobiotica]|uniref:Vacuolar protein sorting-associated protein 8 n=1 Tax=Lithohypha guttulata TaxID=1690604 RepID=A0ABR0JYL2_9EURO|nr:Vacuolar protein sorting-associated protein 8 [Lithohypha guttulata]KAK5311272.1 Vacuolar protein sorting-associated protein 8 [Exophiala xenobiotica]
MSSTPEDGEVEQPDAEVVEEGAYTTDLSDETPPIIDEQGDLDQDVDTIPQLDGHAEAEPAGRAQLRPQTSYFASLQPAIQLTTTSPGLASPDDSASIPDDTPSLQDSGVSSPQSEAQLPPPIISRKSSTASRRPFELRFQSRLSSSFLSPRAASPAFLGPHSRHSSHASFARGSESGIEEDTQTPWEVIRWNKLKRLTGQAFSESGRRNFGSPTCLAVTDQIAIGTSKGLILVFDHHQNNKGIIGVGTKAAEAGPVTALAISADHTAIAAGHATGNIYTWEVARPGRPFLQIPALDSTQSEARKADGHVQGSAVLHIGFLGYRRTALVSADDKGMAFSHLATRGTGALARTVRITRILGRYPDVIVRKTDKPVKKSSVLAFSPLPLGNVEQNTDSLGLVAMLTPYLLVIVSTTPIAQTQHKAARPKEIVAHSAMTAALAWFPAIKLKGSGAEASKNKLAYAWSNMLNVLDVQESPRDPEAPENKPIELQFPVRSRYESEEAIVAIQWLSRSVMAVLTITQQLLIIEDVTMNVTDAFDLLPKNVYHTDLYSHQLQSVIEHHDEDDAEMHGVVADAYYMSFRGYKGRLFLLGSNDMWWGSLTNWADRLLAMMETGDYIGAIRLATSYFSGSGEKVTIGLPEDNVLRSTLVHDKLLEMMSASLRYAFGKNEQAHKPLVDRQQLFDLAVACVAACLKVNEKDYLFDEVFEWFEENEVGDIFVDVLEPHIMDRQITTLPASAVKTLINHFSKTHSPSELEEIICLLDATAMDVDQVTGLCKQHSLYDAYIYVWNTALFDYTTPLLELLKMAAEPEIRNRYAAAATPDSFTSQKMFPYLSFILTGRVYPVGEFMEDDRASTAKTQIYETLFYGKGGQKDPFAVLRSILVVDTPSFMAAMNEAFEDSFLNSTQDEDLEGNAPEVQRGSLFNRQIIVRILLDVMSTGFEADDRLYLDMFIARNLPKYPQYMLLAGTTMEQVFTRICQYEDEDSHDDAQLSVEYLLTVYKPANISAFIPLLQRAQFYRILKTVYRHEGDWTELLQVYFIDAENQTQVFDLILECLRESSGLDAEQRQLFTVGVKQHTEDLAKIDVSKTARVVDLVLPEEHSFFFASLAAEAKTQFSYLRTLLEPSDGARKSYHTTSVMLEQYVRLMCQYDPSHIVAYIDTMKEGELQLEEVLPALETSGNIDATVILLARQGQAQSAMERLIKHLSAIEAALTGVLENAADSPDEVATNEAIEDLLESIDKYAKVGIWLCENQMQHITLKGKTASKSPRRSSTKQPLSFEENLWLEFIVAVVAIAQKIGPGPARVEGVEPDTDELSTALRNTIQRVFTALLSSTATARGQAQGQSDSLRFVRILRAFLLRAAEISPSLSHLRHVMSSIFSAYAYEESLLSLSNAMLDKDLFVQVDEVTKLRRMGWRPRGQVCGICRRRVWGPGTGLRIWERWEKKEKQGTKRKELHRRRSATTLGEEYEDDGQEVVGKGKRRSLPPQDVGSDDEAENKQAGQVDLGPIVVFSCRHLFHRRCLDQSQEPDAEDAGERAAVHGGGNFEIF